MGLIVSKEICGMCKSRHEVVLVSKITDCSVLLLLLLIEGDYYRISSHCSFPS